jgi:YgiT-type zinc finger domain-containing protein
MENGFTTHVAELKNCIVIIKNVPCMKCTQCGETVFTGTVLKKIEHILSACESAMTEVAIVNFKTAA